MVLAVYTTGEICNIADPALYSHVDHTKEANKWLIRI